MGKTGEYNQAVKSIEVIMSLYADRRNDNFIDNQSTWRRSTVVIMLVSAGKLFLSRARLVVSCMITLLVKHLLAHPSRVGK